jgi:hypothetical protein
MKKNIKWLKEMILLCNYKEMTDTKKSGKAVKTENVEKKESKKNTKQVEEKKVESQPEQKQVEKKDASAKFEEQLTNARKEYDQVKDLLKSIGTNLKKLQDAHKSDLKNATKSKKSERKKNHTPTGFARLRPVSGKLAEFIGVESGKELTGPAVTKLVWAELKNRGLTWKGDEKKGVKGDQRVLRVDKEVSKIFNVPMSVNESTDHKDKSGFNFGNLQSYIKKAMGEENPAPAPVEKQPKKLTKN